MNKIIINASEFSQEIDMLERFYYEIEARTKILNYMIKENNEENEIFKKYWENFLEYLKAYDNLKNDFYRNHLSEYTEGNWTLDFMTKEVVISD